MNDHPLERVPPHDAEAEQAVLSSMLFDKEAIITAYAQISKDDFYYPANQVIYEVMTELLNMDSNIDIITVKSQLASKGLLDSVGGMEYLTTLVSGYFTAAYIERYAAIVKEKSVLRRLIKASAEISATCYRGEKPLDQILASAQKSIIDISQNLSSGAFSQMSSILESTLAGIEKVYLAGGRVSGVESGFTDLDFMTTGFKPSDLVLIAARPSMGKTAFALNIAQYVGVKTNTPVAIFSLEMSKEQLAARMLCSQANVDSNKLRTGDLDDDEWGRILDALEPLRNAPIYIDDASSVSPMEVRSKCRRLRLEKGLGLILIDYLQLMSGSSRTESRQQEISDISRSLKAIAKDIDVPVIALSQLSRACEQRKDHRPMLSDLRESGAIEQDADIVTFIYRDEKYDEFSEDKGIAEIIIAKQRNGPTGTVRLRWLDKFTKFTGEFTGESTEAV
ncbi:MAG: replicative DNA helicase [Defluviitaleaceae bacterium]|nr:replicative DNA helicase [Defluviitaleaceae bacterium]